MNARFKGKGKKGMPRLHWINNVNEDITSLALRLRGAMDIDIIFCPRTIKIIYSYPSLPNDWHRELMMLICMYWRLSVYLP